MSEKLQVDGHRAVCDNCSVVHMARNLHMWANLLQFSPPQWLDWQILYIHFFYQSYLYITVKSTDLSLLLYFIFEEICVLYEKFLSNLFWVCSTHGVYLSSSKCINWHTVWVHCYFCINFLLYLSAYYQMCFFFIQLCFKCYGISTTHSQKYWTQYMSSNFTVPQKYGC